MLYPLQDFSDQDINRLMESAIEDPNELDEAFECVIEDDVDTECSSSSVDSLRKVLIEVLY